MESILSARSFSWWQRVFGIASSPSFPPLGCNDLFMTVASLKSRVDSAPIPAARKADIRPKISVLQNQVRKLQKKIAEENVQKAVKVATEAAEVAASNGKVFCISRVDVGLDAAAVQKVLEKGGIKSELQEK